MIKVLSKREKTILYTTIGVIIFSIVFNFLIMPVLIKNKNLNEEIDIIQAKLKKYLQLLSQKEYIQSKYNKFSADFKVSGQEQEGTLVVALSELENLAKEANIRIIDIRPQAAKKLTLYKEALIDLKTEGTIEGYLKFIYNIENSPLLLSIKRLQLNAKPKLEALEGSFSILQVLPSSP